MRNSAQIVLCVEQCACWPLHTLMHTLYPCIPYTSVHTLYPCIPRCIPYTSALPILDLASPLGSLLLSTAAACIHNMDHICIREISLAWLSPRCSRIQVFNWQRTTGIFGLDNLWTKRWLEKHFYHLKFHLWRSQVSVQFPPYNA